jgi:uncharacterized protein (DUF1330 family)
MPWVDPSREQFERFKDLPRDRPIHMLNLVRFRDRADYPRDHPNHGKGLSGRDAYREYGRAIAPILARVGARRAWGGALECTVTGPDGEWDEAFVMGYPSAAAFLEMVTDREYRRHVAHRTAAVADSRLIRFAPSD